jgi:hypothetical protein
VGGPITLLECYACMPSELDLLCACIFGSEPMIALQEELLYKRLLKSALDSMSQYC